MALNTNGRPAILLFDMLKLTSFSPMAVIMSERQVEDAALRDDAVDGWGTGQFLVVANTIPTLLDQMRIYCSTLV